MKVRVDQSRCKSHYVCNLIAPTIFVVDDLSDFPTVFDGDLDQDQLQKSETAALSCPERAIIIE